MLSQTWLTIFSSMRTSGNDPVTMSLMTLFKLPPHLKALVRFSCYEERNISFSRIYTGIHALKSKPKFKTGGISESTTALKVDHLNNSAYSVDPKNAVSGAALPLPVPVVVPSGNATNGGNNHDQLVDLPSAMDAGVGASATPCMQKKEVLFAKVPSDKKKMDARKKSLKRL